MSDQSKHIVKWTTFGTLLVLSTLFYCIAPYFAPVAHNQFHMSTPTIGYVFAAFPAGYLLTSTLLTLFHPLQGRSLRFLTKSINLCAAGILVFSVLFALTPLMLKATSPDPSPYAYMTLFVVFWLLNGVLLAVVHNTTLLIVVAMFPDKVSEMVGQWQGIESLGVFFGPLLGGVIYDLGGFWAPTVALASIGLSVAVACGIVFRKHFGVVIRADEESSKIRRVEEVPEQRSKKEGAHIDRTINREEEGNNSKDSVPLLGRSKQTTLPTVDARPHIVRVLTLPLGLVGLPLLCAAVGLGLFVFVESITPLFWTNEFHLTATELGVLFASTATVYAVWATVFGKLCASPSRQRLRPLFSIAAQLLLSAVVASIGGPADLCHVGLCIDSSNDVPRASNLTLSLSAIMLGAFAWGTITVAGISLVVDTARLQDEALVSTAGTVANAMQSLGSILGPIIGSHLVAATGFRDAFAWMAYIPAAVAAVYLAVIFVSASGFCRH